MKPDPQLVAILQRNKCKVMYRGQKTFMYIWIEYGDLSKNKKGAGLEIWGSAQQVFDKINSLMLRVYPTAELASQAGNRTVVYRIGTKFNP